MNVVVGVTTYTFNLIINQANRKPSSINVNGNAITLDFKEYGQIETNDLDISDYYTDLDANTLYWRIYKNGVRVGSTETEVLSIAYTSSSSLSTLLGSYVNTDGIDTYSCVLKAYDGTVESDDTYTLTVNVAEPLPALVFTGPTTLTKTMYKSDISSISTVLETFSTNIDSTVSLTGVSSYFKVENNKLYMTTLTYIPSKISQSLSIKARSVANSSSTVNMNYTITILKELVQKITTATIYPYNKVINFVNTFNYSSGSAFTFTNTILSVNSAGNLVVDTTLLNDGIQTITTGYTHNDMPGTEKTITITIDYKSGQITPNVSLGDIETLVPNGLVPDSTTNVITVPSTEDIKNNLTGGTAENNRVVRKEFVKKLLTNNESSINAGSKVVMKSSHLLGTSSTITKEKIRIISAGDPGSNGLLPTPIREFDTSTLDTDEGIHTYMETVGDYIILIIDGKKIKFEKISDTQYKVYADYVDESTEAITLNAGASGTYGSFAYVLGSVSGQINVTTPPPSVAPICFPAGTPVTTNQGLVAIENLNPDIHTIRNKRIVAITQTRPLFAHIVSIEKDALGKNVPNATTQISKEHCVFYKGKMTRAIDLVNICKGVTKIPYNGETLYNVLMEKHNYMMINNLICETLHPDNIMAKICGGKYNPHEQDKICEILTKIIKTNNIQAYKRLYASLK